MYKLSKYMYACFLINGLLNIYISQKSRIALFKDVLDIYLQPHQVKEPWSLDYGSNTVKPAVAATSIKRDPPLSGHFRAPRTILNANAPLLSVHLSNAASGRRYSPQNAEIVSSNGIFLYVDAASFDQKLHRLTFLHRSYAWCN